MKVGIVILNYNDLENTKDIIERIKNYQNINYIVVVDNASKDNSYEALKKYNSQSIKVLQSRENKGYGAGNNIGLRYLEENNLVDIAIISNPDVLVKEKVIDEIIKDFSNTKISFLAPIIKERGHEIKGYKLPNYLSEFLSNINYFNRYSKKFITYPDNYYQNKLTKVEVLHGCFFACRLKDFQKINYFDEKTFLYYEENILGKKAKKANLELYVDKDISVEHNLSVSVDKSLNKIKKYKILKNSQLYYEKEYNHLNIILLLGLRLMYYISLGILYLTWWI